MASFPQHLLDGYRTFTSQRLPTEQSRYRELSERGQSPAVMVIGCCDSRVSPEVIFDAGPGELFVVRNVANLVPVYQPDGGAHGVSAALEYAVRALHVKHVVVLGHAQCGGIRAFIDDIEPLSPGDSGSTLLMKARTPPHWACPSTTMCFTRSARTANSSAADTPCAPASGA
jgi:carbonic anhydrase